jgi:hypothetical protein
MGLALTYLICPGFGFTLDNLFPALAYAVLVSLAAKAFFQCGLSLLLFLVPVSELSYGVYAFTVGIFFAYFMFLPHPLLMFASPPEFLLVVQCVVGYLTFRVHKI